MSKAAAMNLLADRPVAYHPDIARVVGSVKAAVFLCQLLYWTGKGKRQDGFIWKTQAEMEEETALTRYEQEGARKKLLSLGILEEKRAGVPAKMHYRVRTNVLAEILDAFYRTQDCGKAANKDEENPQTITETTTEITSTAPAKAGEPPPKRRKPRTKQKKPTPVAVRVFRENAHYYPAKAWYENVADVVGDKPADLTRWGQVVKAWVGLGWNPTNVKGMLEHFERNEIPEGGRNAKKRKSDGPIPVFATGLGPPS